MKKTRLLHLVTYALMALSISFFAGVNVHAQDNARIRGAVTDAAGAKIKGASVVLRSRFGLHLSTATDETGSYNFSTLRPGSYLLEVSAVGFSVFTSRDVRIGVGDDVVIDVELNLAGINANVVITATGTIQRTDEVAKALTTITSQQFEASHQPNLSEGLRGTPGLRVQQQGSPGAITSLRLRGQRNFDTSILFDGLRIRDAADINGSAVPFITGLLVNDVDRVEVLRGSGSSIYGTNAIGGVINIVPKAGSGTPSFEALFEGGGLALFRERLQGSGGIGGKGGFSFGLTRLDVRRGIDGEDEYGNTGGTARLQYALSPTIEVSANFFGTTSNARVNNNPQPIVGAPASGQLFPRATELVNFHPDFNNPDQGRRNSIWSATFRFSHFLNEAVSYSVAYQHVGARRRNYNGPAFEPQFASLLPFGEFEFTSINNGKTDTLDARVNIGFHRTNIATVGFEFENETLFQRFMSAFGSPPGATDRQRTFAIFGQDQISLRDGRLQLSIGARQQFFRIRAADRPGPLAAISADSSITGDGAIAYFFHSTGTKLRAHVGNGFRAPSLFERFGDGVFQNVQTRFGDPTLRAEQSIAVDAGFDQRLAEDRLIFGLTYFYTRLQRVIDFKNFRSFFNPTGDPDPLGLGRTGGFVNFPGGISRGVEAYMETAPSRGTSLRSSYTYTNSDRFAVPGGLQPQFVTPAHQFGLSFTQRYRRFLAHLFLNRIGEYLAPVFPSTFRFDGYTKVDAFLTYEHAIADRSTLVLFGGADNIFDEKYFENGFRAPGIVVRGGVKIRF
jgi:vitamin B12 transporter